MGTMSAEYWREYRAKNREKDRERGRERAQRRYAEYRVWMASLKHAVGCQICGEDYWGALEFHHTGADEKEGIIATNWTWSEDRRFREMEKCTLVCANCHRKVHGGVLQAPALGSVNWRSIAAIMALLVDIPIVAIGAGAPRVMLDGD